MQPGGSGRQYRPMKLWSQLPKDRFRPGRFWLTDDAGTVVFGPVPCRGEADNSGAVAHGNPIEDPTKAYGDHPAGSYRVLEVFWDPQPVHSYGPAFLKLEPTGGEAFTARVNGRSGIGIHGGDPGPNGELRPTFGCLRLSNENIQVVAHVVDELRRSGAVIPYECTLEPEGAVAHA